MTERGYVVCSYDDFYDCINDVYYFALTIEEADEYIKANNLVPHNGITYRIMPVFCNLPTP